jgi:hypothetical protein
MRKLVIIASDHYVRQFLDSGALSGIDDGDLYFVASRSGVASEEVRGRLESLPGYVGDVEDPRPRAEGPYAHLRMVLLAGLRRRSRTMRAKFRLWPRRQRIVYGLLALPFLRGLVRRLAFRRAGLHPGLARIFDSLRPELVIAPTGGQDSLVWDALRLARAQGVQSLCLIHNWDNLSSKGAFPVRPDRLAVWGPQSVDFAERIHRFPREDVTSLGAPSLDPYFHMARGATRAPFEFPYVLFAGCYGRFDERRPLELLDSELARSDSNLKIVYRPHPHRHPRAIPDRVDENELPSVVIDPQVRDAYFQTFAREYSADGRPAERLRPVFPSLDYYPALLENARFVVCPLSTMIVEAAIFDRRVLVIAYDDGIHPDSPARVVNYDHFGGIDRIEGFDLVTSEEEMLAAFRRLIADPEPIRPLRDQLGWWLHHDERPYSERLLEVVRSR